MFDLDSEIDAAHRQAEETEQQARALEARIIKAGGTPPKRPYGRPVDPAAVRQNLSLVSVLNRRDPALASFLGVQSGAYRKVEEEREARAMAAQALQMQTEQLRQQNQQAQHERYRQQLAGVDAWGRPRWAR